MANPTVVSNVIKILGGFTIGVAATTGLHSFTGTSFLTNTQTEVNGYVKNVQDSMNDLSSYLDGNNVLNDEVIKQYKDALKEANSNIDQLIAYYSANESATNEELAQLQAKVNNLQANVDAQVQSQVDDVIAKANAEIDKANTESETTYNNVHATLTDKGSNVNEMVQGIKDKNKELKVTDEELQVRDISGIVGGGSQTPTTPQEPSQTPTTPQEPSVQEPTTTPQPDTSETGKSEETPSLHITDVTTEDDVKIYDEFNVGSRYTVYTYTFSDGKQWEVTKYNYKVQMVNLDGYGTWRSVTNNSVKTSEFVTGGYMDLINNY